MYKNPVGELIHLLMNIEGCLMVSNCLRSSVPCHGEKASIFQDGYG